MAQEKTSVAAAEPLAADKEPVVPSGRQVSQPMPRPCPQDCRRCGMDQRSFCAAKMLFDMSGALQEMGRQVASIEKAVADIRAQLQPRGQDTELSIPFSE